MRLLTLLSAAVVSLCIAAAVTTAASAQTATTVQDHTSAEVKSRFDEIIKKSYQGTTEEKATAKKILDRHSGKLKNLGRSVLVRGALVGVASEVWAHNIKLLYYANTSGQVYELDIEGNFSDSPNAMKAKGVNPTQYRGAGTSYVQSVKFSPNADNPAYGSLELKVLGIANEYRCGTSSCTAYTGTHKLDRLRGGAYETYVTMSGYTEGGSFLSSNYSTTDFVMSAPKPPAESHYSRVLVYKAAGIPTSRSYQMHSCDRNISTGATVCPPSPSLSFSGTETVEVTPDNFDVKDLREVPPRQNDADDYRSTPDEGTAFVNGVANDPEAAGLVPPGAEHPWDRPDRKWDEIRPPGNQPDDAEIFGPYIVGPREGENWIYWQHEDGTDRWYDKRFHEYLYFNKGRMIVGFGDGSYQYRESTRRWPAAVCLPEGDYVYHKVDYGDGTTRQRWLPAGTRDDELHTAQPVCEVWKDSQGNEIPPKSSSGYEIRPVPTPPPDPNGAF